MGGVPPAGATATDATLVVQPRPPATAVPPSPATHPPVLPDGTEHTIVVRDDPRFRAPGSVWWLLRERRPEQPVDRRRRDLLDLDGRRRDPVDRQQMHDSGRRRVDRYRVLGRGWRK